MSMIVLTFLLYMYFADPVYGKLSRDATIQCEPCLCSNIKAIHADCSGLSLTRVPDTLPLNTGVLNIANNSISSFNKSLDRYVYLKSLNVSSNELSQLARDDFVKLNGLEVLDLHQNSLPLSPVTYPRGLFRNQRKVTSLFLHHNSETVGSHLQYPDETFSELISLQTLFIDGLNNCVFGKGFKKLLNLSSLSLKGNCNIETLQNDSFVFFSNVKNISIDNCGLLKIEPVAFSGLSNQIEYLDLSLNIDLGITNFGHALHGLHNKSVRTLKANRLHRRRGTGILVRHEDLKYLQYTDIHELQIEGNRIELLDMDVPLLFSSLKRLSLKQNMLLFGGYLLTGSAMKDMLWFDMSGQHTSYVDPYTITDELELLARQNTSDFDTSYSKDIFPSNKAYIHHGQSNKSVHKLQNLLNDWTENGIIYPPAHVTFVNISRSKFSLSIPAKTFASNNLRTFDLSHNFFTKWFGAINGLEKLEYIDLSNNYCDYMSIDILTWFPALRILKLGSNYLSYTLNNALFTGVPKLEHLDLSNNKINHLPTDIFQSLTSLEYLDLSLNYLHTWNVTVEKMANLTMLDLSKNEFEQVPEGLMKQIIPGSLKKIKVSFNGNPFKCNCNTLTSLRWIHKNGQRTVADILNLTCLYYNGLQVNMADLNNIIPELEKNCASHIGVTIGSLGLIILFLGIAVGGILYRYRWKIRYLYYLALNRYRDRLPGQDEEQNFEFDAFISYADEDRGFVVRDMRNILEEPEEQTERFRLCIHHRDFLAGEAIAANILKAINTSRKTVVILTRNFLKSYWCRYEVEMAKMESIYRGRNTLLIVVMEDIPVKDLPVDIVKVMRNDSYVEFTNDREGQEVFWRNVKRAIQNC